MNTQLIPTLGYGIYLITVTATLLVVSRLILRHGLIFIRQGHGGDEDIASATAGMLRTQFNLISAALMLLLIRFGSTGRTWLLFPEAPRSVPALFEVLSVKIGAMLLVIGVTHFLSLRRINRIRTTGGIF